jgi:hypothetical protein
MAECLDEQAHRVFSRLSPAYVGFQVVEMPSSWRDDKPGLYTFGLFERELGPGELQRFFMAAAELGLPNPRPLSASLLELASLFHPLLFASFANGKGLARGCGDVAGFVRDLRRLRLVRQPRSSLPVTSARYHLQSLLFLSGCTLSAAIVQERFSPGTINSKLDRLWQAGQQAIRLDYEDLKGLDLQRFVLECAQQEDAPSLERLIAIKRIYGAALGCLATGLAAAPHRLRRDEMSAKDEERFGFVGQLQERLGSNLEGVFVYGSAVTSQSFADYDLILVVGDAEKALRHLAGTHPSYRGLQLNLSVYGRDDFFDFQLMSGDNLNHNARCIYGEAEVPIKPTNDLMLRNFSFAFIRLRQLLGMAGYLAGAGRHGGLDGKDSLYHYFIKIPMHIMKGVRSVAKEPIAKESLNAWIAEALGYDFEEQLALCERGQLSAAITNAYLGTQGVIAHLNERYGVFEPTPAEVAREEDAWRIGV